MTNRIKLLVALALCLIGLAALAQHFIIQHRVNRQLESLDSILQRLGPGFENVHTMRSTHPAAWLQGHVANQTDLARLPDTLRTRFDDQEARRIITQVRIASQ